MDKHDKLVKDIETYIDLSIDFHDLYKHLSLKETMGSMFLNFRDALTHYVRLSETGDKGKRDNEMASIKEHLYRGLKDAYVFTINEMRDRVYATLQKESNRKKQRVFREDLHLYKKLEIEVRENTGFKELDQFASVIDNLFKSIANTKKLYKDNDHSFNMNRTALMPREETEKSA